MAVARAKNRRRGGAAVDAAALQSAALALAAAPGLTAGEAALGEMSALIAKPRAIWSGDVAAPLHDPAAQGVL
ncbi:hypothetical protein, partial [Parvibaculum sp.]|uniref:hypothetical protein n=1 Tax=Parvibaculum sp. TaxID=2024848 RepID=UPI0032EBA9B4